MEYLHFGQCDGGLTTLKSSGIDLIKVDGQSALTEFTRPHYGRVSSMRAYQEALANQPILIGTALLAVYIVLGILYESLIHPLTIIST